MKLYQEHFKEHPEEYAEIQAIRDRTARIEAIFESRRKEKLKQIEECRRLLNAKHSV